MSQPSSKFIAGEIIEMPKKFPWNFLLKNKFCRKKGGPKILPFYVNLFKCSGCKAQQQTKIAPAKPITQDLKNLLLVICCKCPINLGCKNWPAVKHFFNDSFASLHIFTINWKMKYLTLSVTMHVRGPPLTCTVTDSL